MSFIYTRSQFVSRINAGIQNRIGVLVDKNETANEAVREVLSQIDLRSTKRQSALAPKLFNGIYDYAWAADGKASKIIDLPPQIKRQDGEWFLVPAEEFDRNKGFIKGELAIDRNGGLNTLKVASNLQDFTLQLSQLDSLTSGGGTWVIRGDFGSLAADTGDYLSGGGSLSGSIIALGLTTAGISNTNLNSTDITQYLGGNGSLFVSVKINDPANITSYTMEIGSDSSNFYSKTVTAQNDGTAFVAGWNILRFDLTSLAKTLNPVITAIKYFSVYMNKTVGKVSETGYKFDNIVLKKGSIYNIKYYSKYGWNNASGAWIENSSDNSDVLAADTDEYGLFVLMGRIKAYEELKEYDVVAQLQQEWEKKKAMYQMENPSEAKILTNEYYNYRSIENNHNYDNNGNRTDSNIYP